MPLIALLLRNRRLAALCAGLAIILAIFGYIYIQGMRLKACNSQMASIEQAARDWNAAAKAELERQQKEAERASRRYNHALREINNAPDSENGGLAPVLRDTLRLLGGEGGA